MKLVINNLSKTYANGVFALKGISLTLSNGLFGLLGPNGAGKSSLMRTLATLQEADSGSVFLDHLDVLKNKTEVRQLLGYLPQDFGVYPTLTAGRLLDHIAQLKGVSNSGERKDLVDALLAQVNLLHDRKKQLGTFSGGMKQRFGIAQALIGEPRLIIVDEPTAGLDPTERNRFYNMLSSLGEERIVILSTHIVEDISTLCSNFAIINQGQVCYVGEPEQAMEALRGQIYTKAIAATELVHYQQGYHIISTQLRAGRLYIRAIAAAPPGDDFSPAETNLEDVYFAHIANRLTDVL